MTTGYSGLRVAGVIGYSWSAQSYSSGDTLVYRFYFNASEVNPSYGYDRYHAFPVRCPLLFRSSFELVTALQVQMKNTSVIQVEI